MLSEPLLLGLASSLELIKSVRLFLSCSPRLVFPCIEEIGSDLAFDSLYLNRRTFSGIRNAIFTHALRSQ